MAVSACSLAGGIQGALARSSEGPLHAGTGTGCRRLPATPSRAPFASLIPCTLNPDLHAFKGELARSSACVKPSARSLTSRCHSVGEPRLRARQAECQLDPRPPGLDPPTLWGGPGLSENSLGLATALHRATALTSIYSTGHAKNTRQAAMGLFGASCVCCSVILRRTWH